jgi:hypothetical protein
MGHAPSTSIVYVGTARLPQPSASAAGALAVELVVDPAAGRIVATSTNAGLPSLDRLIWEVFVGSRVTQDLEAPLLEIEVRYCSPLTVAVRKAIENALRRARHDALQRSRAHAPSLAASRAVTVG